MNGSHVAMAQGRTGDTFQNSSTIFMAHKKSAFEPVVTNPNSQPPQRHCVAPNRRLSSRRRPEIPLLLL